MRYPSDLCRPDAEPLQSGAEAAEVDEAAEADASPQRSGGDSRSHSQSPQNGQAGEGEDSPRSDRS